MKVASMPAFVHDGFVGGTQGVVAVLERELHLAGGVFGDGAFDGDALGIGGGPEIAQEGIGVGKFGETIGAVQGGR
jgi:hypothetical protein